MNTWYHDRYRAMVADRKMEELFKRISLGAAVLTILVYAFINISIPEPESFLVTTTVATFTPQAYTELIESDFRQTMTLVESGQAVVIPRNTPVKVISRSPEGAIVRVESGEVAGLDLFVEPYRIGGSSW